MPPPNDLSGVHIESSAEMRYEDHPSNDNTSSNAQAQMLVMALRSMIIPLIQAAVPNCPDLRNVSLKFEAEDFLAALQKQVSCIIRDTSGSDNQKGATQTVDLEDLPLRNTRSVNSTNQEADKIGPNAKEPNKHSWGIVPSQQQRSTERQSNFYNTVGVSGVEKWLNTELTRLREHVFNSMLIRLLCFEKHGSKLDITLLDRAGIYSHLVPKIKDAVKSGYRRSPSYLPRSESDSVKDIAVYAILSHTWLRSASGEITYEDWNNLKGALDLTHPGYQKLVNFCKTASTEHGLTLGWMDTVCINKASSVELDESIRSMYKWYQHAKVCITYLAETTTFSGMAKDTWFTRGWTLQELLAPTWITFYDCDWRAIVRYSRLGSSINPKTEDVLKQIELATTITSKELNDLQHVSISRKMQWAAKREVTREEDAAYSLMGIFNVNMSIAYGEGGKVAFIRLLKEILSNARLDAVDIFNWGGRISDRSPVSALLPSSPRAYLQRSALNFGGHMSMEPLTLTHLGLRVPVLLLSASSTLFPTDTFTAIGDYYATIIASSSTAWPSRSYQILDVEGSPAVLSSQPLRSSKTIAFGILNCSGDESSVCIPHNCFAIAILYNNSGDITMINPVVFGSSAQVATEQPIVFSLKNRRAPQDSEHTIKRTELARHGMCLRNMYL